MNKCPEQIVHYMHEYLDGDISGEHEQELKTHLASCPSCQQHMHELSKVAAFVQSASHISAPNGFVEGVTARLPKETSKVGMKRWFHSHPLLTAAALFMILMSASLFSSFNEDQHFSFTKQPNLVVEGEKVIVPAGEIVIGDLVVKNGDLQIDGEVDGNVTVINGQYMASTANVTGEIEEINQVFDWLWYKIKAGAKDVASLVDGKEDK
ncbi:anti-sigma factor [Paenisporosarcina quisquiliarum]|uniref:Anti-sigma-W factor RsiW n=1 Tax=Paenisporosarcina quisquiliarum TaxID=365346 RepID=A0A9X3RE38_9BACL|nr:anti-sigma factor [Paenisporosarcina quisquiliarum]MCZ8536958.1 anti-sigma factor [Paenisporosarcina quisquiliarum]